MIRRRDFLLGVSSLVLFSVARSEDQGCNPPQDEQQSLLYHTFGNVISPKDQQQAAQDILNNAKGATPYEYMSYLMTIANVPSGLKDRYGNDETYNERWDKFANPLIRQIFKEIGSPQPISAGDCTAWCAATVAWCMKKCGYGFAKNMDPIVALDWKGYGKEVGSPDVGDLVVFKNIDNPGKGHVGFYNNDNQILDTIKVRGGNQNQPPGKVKVTQCGSGTPNNFIGDHVFPLHPGKSDNTSLRLVGYYRYTSLPHK